MSKSADELMCVERPRVDYTLQHRRLANADGSYEAAAVGVRYGALAPGLDRGGGEERPRAPAEIEVAEELASAWGPLFGYCEVPARGSIAIPVDGDLRRLDAFAVEMAIYVPSLVPSSGRAPSGLPVQMTLMEAPATGFSLSLRGPRESLSLRGNVRLTHAGAPEPVWDGVTAVEPIKMDTWMHVGMVFTGDEVYLLQQGEVTGGRVFRDARIRGETDDEQDKHCFVATAADGRNHRFAGRIGGLRIWSGVPAKYQDALDRARRRGVGAIQSKYADTRDAARLLGEPDGEVTRVDGIGERGAVQRYRKGAIYWSAKAGAHVVHYPFASLHPDKTGLGLPLSDVRDTRVRNLRISKVVRYENGAAFWTPELRDETIPVVGAIFERYLLIGAEKSYLGLPVERANDHRGDRRAQRFQGGMMFLEKEAGGAFDLGGEILSCYRRLELGEGPLGWPTSSEGPVHDASGEEIGRLATFNRGVIYRSADPRAGAHALTDEWLQAYRLAGGPQGALGFPISDEGTVAGTETRYIDFEHGVLVRTPEGRFFPVTQIQLTLGRVWQRGNIDDGLGDSGAELLVDAWIRENDQPVEGKFGHRFWFKGAKGRDSFDFGGWGHVIRRVQHDTKLRWKVTLHDVDGESDDDILAGRKGPDYLGSTDWAADITNLWGLEGGDGQGVYVDHRLTTIGEGGQDTDIEGRSWGAKANAFNFEFTIASPAKPIDWRQDFRCQGWWRFDNFSTESLSAQLCETTYTDINHIDPESWLEIALNPVDTLFKEVYEGLAAKGNCFGMSVAALWAYHGKSLLREHLYENYPRATDAVKREINIRHGYQLGAPYVSWVIDRLLSLDLLDPRASFDAARRWLNLREPTVISMFEPLAFRGHSVLAYGYEPGSGDVHGRLVVADPNAPFRQADQRQLIEVMRNGSFRTSGMPSVFASTRYDLGLVEVPDVFLLDAPWSVFSTEPASVVSILWELLLGAVGVILLVAGDAETEQVSAGAQHLYGERDGKRRIVANGIPGMVRYPLQQANRRVNDMHMQRGRTAENLSVALVGTKEGRYRHGFATGRAAIEVDNEVSPGARDKLEVRDVQRATPTLSLTTSQRLKTGRVKYHVLHDPSGRGQRGFEVTLQQARDEAALAGICSHGEALVVRPSGPLKPFDVTLTRMENGRVVRSMLRGVQPSATGEVIRLAPQRWGVADTDVRVEHRSSLDGAAIKSTLARATRVEG